MISDTYSKKIDSCLNALDQLEIKVETIIQKYKNIKMPESEIIKSEFFKSILERIFNMLSLVFLL